MRSDSDGEFILKKCLRYMCLRYVLPKDEQLRVSYRGIATLVSQVKTGDVITRLNGIPTNQLDTYTFSEYCNNYYLIM